MKPETMSTGLLENHTCGGVCA